MYLVQQTSSALIERRVKYKLVLCHNSDLIVCGTEQVWSFLCPRQEQDFIFDVRDAEPSGSRLCPINIANSVKNIGALKEKLCYYNIIACMSEGHWRSGKSNETTSSTLSTFRATRKDALRSFPNAALKFTTSFNIAIYEESQVTALVVLLA